MILRVNVTQENIDHGWPNSVSGCPIALALRQQTGADWVQVLSFGASLIFDLPDGKTRLERYALSNRARGFIYRVDQHKEVRPSTFILKEIDAGS